MSSLSPDQRIVVTGVEAMTPVGTDLDSSWANLIDGADGMRGLDQTSLVEYPFYQELGAKVVAPVDYSPDNDPLIIDNKRELDLKNWHRSHMLAWRTAYLAARQAGILGKDSLTLREDIDPFRVGSYVGSTFSGVSHLSDVDRSRVRPSDIFNFLFARVATAPAMQLMLKNHVAVVGTECASGAAAVDLGAGRLFKYRDDMPSKADIMIVGGADAPIHPANLAFFESLKQAVDPRDNPREVSRPLDENAQGLVMGEGAGAMVIETWKHAQKRGLSQADVIAELVGWDSLTDAENKTLAGMEGAVRTIENVLRMAGVALGETVYANGHLTGTVGGDKREVEAYKKALARLGLKLDDFWLTSTKGATGHTMGAAGAIEAAFAIMALRSGTIPPALKLENPIPETEGFNLGSRLEATQLPGIDLVISSSLGFGGTATALAFRKFEE